MTRPIRPEDRFTGCLLGLACGDALGAPVERLPRGSFPPVRDLAGGGPAGMAPGEWTDDTAMALCLGESLLQCGGVDLRDQMQRYLRWLDEGHHSTRHHAFHVGKTIGQALQRFRETGEPLAGPETPGSAGNGALMRLAPVPLFFHRDRQATMSAAELSTRTTHGAEECVAASRWFAALLHGALAGTGEKDHLFAQVSDIALPTSMARIARQDFRHLPREKIHGTGYVADSLEAALWCFWHGGTLAEALHLAADLGDDADTTAAICGQLAGAFHGIGAIPGAWLAVLHRRTRITEMACALRKAGEATRPGKPAEAESSAPGIS